MDYSIIKSKKEIESLFKQNLGDSKTCFYKCELRNIKLNKKENDLIDFEICVNKCLELSELKDKLTNNFYKQAKDYIYNPKYYSLKLKINEMNFKAKEYEKLNDKYHFEDFRYSTSEEIKYEDMKKHEIGSLFGRNK